MSKAIQLPQGVDIERFIEDESELFERYVLLHALNDRGFHRNVSGVLCATSDGLQFSYDFEIPHHNVLYYAMSVVFADMPGRETYIPPVGVLYNVLQDMSKAGTLVAEHDIDTVILLYSDILTEDPATAKYYADQGFVSWLTKRKFLVLSGSSIRAASWDPTELVSRLGSALSDVIAIDSNGDSLFTFAELEDYDEPDVDRKSTGIVSVDAVLGGGLGRGEHLLVVAPTGSGKTVLACQLAAELGKQGDCGVLVTTEQQPHELLPRIIAANCNIPFNKISGGMQRGMSRMSEDEILSFRQFQQEMNKRVIITHYNTMPKNSRIELSMAAMLEQAERKLGQKPAFVILDWIGGSIREQARSNPELIRHLYQFAADGMAELASEHNIRTVSFAQTNPKQSLNQRQVNLDMMAENKTMGNNATAVMGISALINKEAHGDATSYLDEQFFHFSKSRKGITRTLRVKRDFAYQRFVQR